MTRFAFYGCPPKTSRIRNLPERGSLPVPGL
jgi:hypothetical protein